MVFCLYPSTLLPIVHICSRGTARSNVLVILAISFFVLLTVSYLHEKIKVTSAKKNYRRRPIYSNGSSWRKDLNHQRSKHRSIKKNQHKKWYGDCNLSVISGSWTPRIRTWNNSGCDVSLNFSQLVEIFSGHSRVVFLGDSQMSRVVHFLLPRLRCKIAKSGSRCGLVGGYLGLDPAKKTEILRPNSSRLEGPIAYGLQHPGCMDCMGCAYLYSVCNITTRKSSPPLAIEFLGVEFARDFELQSALGSTTQVRIHRCFQWQVLSEQWQTPHCLWLKGNHFALPRGRRSRCQRRW